MEKKTGLTIELNGDSANLEASLDRAIEKAEKLNSLLTEAKELLCSLQFKI